MSDAAEPRVILCTAPVVQASALAAMLVGDRLAACVNIIPAVRSIYRWEGAVHDDEESLLVIKTTTDRLTELTTRLVEAHPYDCPEVIALPIEGGHADYLRWLTAQTRPE